MARFVNFSTFGNELYTGKRSYNIVGKRKIWFAIALLLVIMSVLVPLLRGGFNLGIDFRGGSKFTVTSVSDANTQVGQDAVSDAIAGQTSRVSKLANDSVQVETEELSDDDTVKVKNALTQAYHVSEDHVTSNFVGPTWGADVTKQAVIGLGAFVLLAIVLMALYFRTWKMSLAAIVGMLFVQVATAGIYSLTDAEVTPSSIIGFLTILSYSLYDTVVVFDKVRENTAHITESTRRTFASEVNLAVNQTLVRSINTSVVAVLPVAAILFIGAFLLGAGTLLDLSLSLFIGIVVGALSTVFVASPLYVQFRHNEQPLKDQAKRVAARMEAERDDAESSPAPAT